MPSPLDIYRTAYVLIREYGDEAPIIAAKRADALLDLGDMEGRAVWLAVVRAVDELRRGRASAGPTVLG